MQRQRNWQLMKEPGKNPQDQTNEEKISSLHEKEFRVIISKMIPNLGNKMEAQINRLAAWIKRIQKMFNKELEEFMENAMSPHSWFSTMENRLDGGAWSAAVHGVAKSQTQLRDFTFTFHFHELEKEMATHSSVLAWRIPGMGEPGGLPSVG